MSDYITRSDLLREAGPVTEQAAVTRRAATRSPEGAIFLSHSSKDQDLLGPVIRLLERYGATVYVDKKDDSLPPYTNRKTALSLKDRIKKSKKFIVLTSVQSKESRWVPWELGLADGYLTTKNTAILPAVDSKDDYKWAEREYFSIYDRISFGRLEGYEAPVHKVRNQEKLTATELSKWLAKG
ncbi:toll/interleukin-1 receptor domain-containing protein [Rhizobium ruizarguesonis]|uniref:toll/interleukin-1 receptor domain-containing protein n=1 Tax=Rhizobium ruizarguesonis TaxID=2081791 RepID=UPI00102FC520|nr:toll/interleukin-1 receptor domain-containing protein [Rhizobium ruizarguesonis]TAY75146.1 TIR domain-containing protein [Rhizobium ruizarguesonis]TBE02278.1 TIR domain-containing protein [Rhizobium ruizarguesonis]TBF14654.1 TIR domain-containing protein [Rhizobium ruizarguesonis]